MKNILSALLIVLLPALSFAQNHNKIRKLGALSIGMTIDQMKKALPSYKCKIDEPDANEPGNWNQPTTVSFTKPGTTKAEYIVLIDNDEKAKVIDYYGHDTKLNGVSVGMTLGQLGAKFPKVQFSFLNAVENDKESIVISATVANYPGIEISFKSTPQLNKKDASDVKPSDLPSTLTISKFTVAY
ncbi:hypothetical protein [Chitinophaga sancti]|uniref:Uncharacterized protein n=1 Tax=Chitinophaga sancti TaxID=1004 RepID=A0A1K1PRD5_9BACT|nr:hypothetical protein [Chitinophaga sancti]WQD61745.1 hypothetical protein U0033_28085 [Chitinophaga sancti]WQG92697.1 hypothetical protein SR876_14355 [Chitinophaga sancti]SFW50019.1 hypothetical protein SAMN05661012_02120 [Chitinophaga sancti]